MAHVPQEQIDAAFNAAYHGDDPLDLTYKRGWDRGYTMGEDAGFIRGWKAL